MCERVAEACSIANLHADETCADFRYEATIMYACCLEKGLDVMRGGAETYYGHWEAIGLPNAANMVYAANKTAWETGADLAELMRKLEDGQEEKLIQSLRHLQKFGRDQADVDEIAAKLIEILSLALESTRSGRRRKLLLGHLSGGENMHIAYGRHMPATLDGRRAGQPLADSIAGSQGDVSSPTAAIKSICRLDHSRLQAGNVSTLSMTPADFADENGRRNMTALLRAFVFLGGSQLQFNVLDTDILRKAQQNPEQYAGIIVRVAGYSAAFDGLGKTVQDEIIARYESLE
jgi:formate C-acetyltransferase